MGIAALCEVLNGKVRGNPVSISHFPDGIPISYHARKVGPLCDIAPRHG